MFEFDTTYIWY